MKMPIDKAWFETMTAKEGDLEIGAGVMRKPFVPPAYNNCTCSCHRGDGKIHFVPCCRPDGPAMPERKGIRP